MFDRHGRAEVEASIAEIARLLRVDVHILLTWESDDPSVDKLADVVFSAWGLAPHRAILAVFLRTGPDWSASVVASSVVRAELGDIAQRLEQRMADLVDHRRIKEAVRALLNELQRLPSARASATQAQQIPDPPGRGVPIAVVVGVPLAALLGLSILVRLRVCPRCARLLRAQSPRLGASESAQRVYYCPRCGYRRKR